MPRRTGRSIALLCATLALIRASASTSALANTELRPTAREGAAHAVPLYGTVVHAWDAPDDDPFAPGHRGIDVAGPTGAPVRASSDGEVSFAGSVAGNRSVSVDHPDGVRTTYSFLGSIAVKKGDALRQGDVVGSIGLGHPNGSSSPHVHLSARRAGVYFDPVTIYVGSSYSDLLALVR